MVLDHLTSAPFEGWKPVNPEKTALIVIDMQYATGSRQVGVGKLWEKQGIKDTSEYRFGRLEKLVIPNIKKLLNVFRENKLRVLYLTYGSEASDYSDLPLHIKRIAMPANNRKGYKEHEILEELKPIEGEMVINKTTVGAFASTNIDALLRAWGMEFLVFAGVSTYACVDTTARGAADRGYKCVLLEDATAGSSQFLHDATIQNFGRIFGRIEMTDIIINEIRTQLALYPVKPSANMPTSSNR